MLNWIFQNKKKKMNFVGKWKGKGFVIIKNCDNKIIKKNILTKLFIRQINNFSYQVYIRNLIDDYYYNNEFLGFINKKTEILEFHNSIGLSQFYFNNKYLINSFSTNKYNNLSTGTIKLIPNVKHKNSSSSNSSKNKCKKHDKNKYNNLSTGTIKLIPNVKHKNSSSSNSSKNKCKKH
jgi:hypothetical protein